MTEPNDTPTDPKDSASGQARLPVEPADMPPPPPYYYAPPSPRPKSHGMAGRLFVSFLTALLLSSIVLNVYLWTFFLKVTGGPHEATYEDGDAEKRIVILPIKGFIGEDMASFVRTALRQLRHEPPAAMILRIDSGGGFVGESDRIWHELEKFKEDPRTKNVQIVASFGSLAASGAYYVAAAAHFIVAEPSTSTGSIGVIAPGFTIERLLEKIGITPEVIVASKSPNKDIANNITRAWTDEDRSTVRKNLDRAHEQFMDVVFNGRKSHLSREDVKLLARGDVYSTQEAIENKLIDEKGYLDDAIEIAIKRAQIDGKPLVTVIRPPYRIDVLGMFLGTAGQRTSLSAAQLRAGLWDLTTPRLAYWIKP